MSSTSPAELKQFSLACHASLLVDQHIDAAMDGPGLPIETTCTALILALDHAEMVDVAAPTGFTLLRHIVARGGR